MNMSEASGTVFVDLDGTLLDAANRAAPEVMARLDAWRDAGVQLVVCTGRPSGGLASAIAARIGPDLPHIFFGGALTRRGDEAPERAAIIAPALLMDLVAQATATGHALELYTADDIFVEARTPRTEAHARLLERHNTVRDLQEVIEAEAIIKAQWIVPVVEAPALVAATPAGLYASDAVSPALPEITFITLTRAGEDKGSAVEAWAEARGVSLADCAAIGDSGGDVPMLDRVGAPFMMADGPPALVARYPTVSSADEAIARYLAVRRG